MGRKANAKWVARFGTDWKRKRGALRKARAFAQTEPTVKDCTSPGSWLSATLVIDPSFAAVRCKVRQLRELHARRAGGDEAVTAMLTRLREGDASGPG